MATLRFVVELAGATLLLLYAVWLVQTGIQRAFGRSFVNDVLASGSSAIRSASAGLFLAIILQSSAAVALLAATFSSGGAVSFASGLAALLGADLGSAIVVQILSFKLDWLVPLFLAAGGWLFIKDGRRQSKQIGRIILGIAFILISLRFIREAVDPLRDSAFLQIIATYLERDFITAFLSGAVLAFVMHSSVAAILTCGIMVAAGAIPLVAGVSLVFGANLGSGLVAVWLTRGLDPEARRIPVANLLVRGSAAVVALVVADAVSLSSYLGALGPGQALVTVHLGFNFILLAALPLAGFLERPFKALIPEAGGDPARDRLEQMSALDQGVLDSPKAALASMKREVARMAQLVELMARPIMELYTNGDRERIKSVRGMDQHVNDALSGIRNFAAALPTQTMTKQDVRRSHELTEYAINLETAGDIISKHLLKLADDKSRKRIRFSEKGLAELTAMHEKVIANMTIAFEVLASEDVDMARLVLEEKTETNKLERASRRRHLKRLRRGMQMSFESSDIHLETLRGLRELNSHVAAIAYPVLHREGHLLDTRLVDASSD